MRGGFVYGNTLKKYSKRTKTKSKIKTKINLAGRTRKIHYRRKRSKLGKYKKFMHKRSKRNKKSRKYRQKGGSLLNYSYLDNISNEVVQPRLAEGVHFNTIQGYSANLSNPPIAGINPVTQCNNM